MKNLGLYNEATSVPRKQDIDSVVASKQDKIAVSGVLERSSDGTMTGLEKVEATEIDTVEAELVDLPEGTLVIELTGSLDVNTGVTTYSSNPSPDEILAAYKAGQTLVVLYQEHNYYSLVYAKADDESGFYELDFNTVSSNNNVVSVGYARLSKDDTASSWQWSGWNNSIEQLPQTAVNLHLVQSGENEYQILNNYGDAITFDGMVNLFCSQYILSLGFSDGNGLLYIATFYNEADQELYFVAAQPLGTDVITVSASTITRTNYRFMDSDSALDNNSVNTFAEASMRANIATGEKLSVLFGKIQKWFGDLKALAFKDKAAKTDLEDDVQTSLDKADKALAAPATMSANKWLRTDEYGNVALSDLPNAGTGSRGVTYLVDSYTRTDTDKAVTPKALNEVYKMIPSDIPSASDTTPKAPGTAAAGSETAYARGDHVHPNEVFWATYGTTTYAEIKAAHEAGKTIYLKEVPSYSDMGPILELHEVQSSQFGFSVLLTNYIAGDVYASRVFLFAYCSSNNNWTNSSIGIPVSNFVSPTSRKVTLTVAGWNSSTKQQSVACTGVLASATAQLLIPTPVNTAADNPYDAAGIMLVAQGANSVTFYAETIPTEAIEVYVTMYPINYLG